MSLRVVLKHLAKTTMSKECDKNFKYMQNKSINEQKTEKSQQQQNQALSSKNEANTKRKLAFVIRIWHFRKSKAKLDEEMKCINVLNKNVDDNFNQ